MKVFGKPVPGLPNLVEIGPAIKLGAYHNGPIAPRPKIEPKVVYRKYPEAVEIWEEEAADTGETIRNAYIAQSESQIKSPDKAKAKIEKTTATKDIQTSAKVQAAKKTSSSSEGSRNIASSSGSYEKIVKDSQISASSKNTPSTQKSQPKEPPPPARLKIGVFNKRYMTDTTIYEDEFDANIHVKIPKGWVRPRGKWVEMGSFYWPIKAIYGPIGKTVPALPSKGDMYNLAQTFAGYYGGERDLYVATYA